MTRIQVGDWVVYRKTKFSPSPGPRAVNVTPARSGDDYAYQVDKFWTVTAVLDDGWVMLQTRRGKQHQVRRDDPNLRRATLWHRLWYRDRFSREAVA